MKNPFVQMAVMAAAMVAAFREDASRSVGVIPTRGRFRERSGPRNPAGTKMIRRFYRNKHGVKGTAKEAIEWYSNLQ